MLPPSPDTHRTCCCNDLPDRLSRITAPTWSSPPTWIWSSPARTARRTPQRSKAPNCGCSPSAARAVPRAARPRCRRGHRLPRRHHEGGSVSLAVTDAPRSVLLAERPEPCPPKPGQTLVRVETVGICGSDLHLYRDQLGDSHVGLLPRMTGHEFGDRRTARSIRLDLPS